MLIQVHVRKSTFEVSKDFDEIFCSPMSFNKMLHLSEPTFLHAYDGDNNLATRSAQGMPSKCLQSLFSPFSFYSFVIKGQSMLWWVGRSIFRIKFIIRFVILMHTISNDIPIRFHRL